MCLFPFWALFLFYVILFFCFFFFQCNILWDPKCVSHSKRWWLYLHAMVLLVRFYAVISKRLLFYHKIVTMLITETLFLHPLHKCHSHSTENVPFFCLPIKGVILWISLCSIFPGTKYSHISMRVSHALAHDIQTIEKKFINYTLNRPFKSGFCN